MLCSTLISLLLTAVAVEAWRFLNWIWFQPKRMEKILRSQGLKGNSYRFLFGDAKETALIYKESYSKPIGINDDIGPRVMPFISKTLETFGDRSFMWVGPRPLVFIMDEELMKVVMNKHTSFHKSFKISNPIFRRLVGGLIRFEGEKWNKNRKKLNPLFHLDKLRDMVSTMQKLCEEILDEWSNKVPTNGSPGDIDVFPYLPDYTGSVVKRTFSIISELTLLANQAQPFSIPGEQYLPTKKYRRANAIENELTHTFTNMIQERLKKRNTREINGELDLFDMFLDELNEVDTKDKKDHAMVIHEIIQQCKLFFMGGYETSSNLVTWTIIMLAVHKDWQDRAREEVLQVLGNKNKMNADDLGQLKILNMVVHEVLCLYPPSIEVSRVVEEETSLGEFYLPKGTMLMLPVILLHRNPKIWGKDVLEFKPERFAEGVLKAANGHASFIPFGWGVRNCIRANLAVWETKVFVTLFLRRFSFEISPTYAHGPLVSLNM
ncbi:Cytochrome P450 CYP4/CYP19/CYP26 subfamily [Handroanthus impetiginosus]|uniref:Cytochrome P450 CYP4/CYP19/CYP26 subfamily n=1 Tax=Handroanthus impetiginosus TaxID=429701 RepID=A0A2G9GUR9_9LAMI|nr:Cytochrome P450 CYP4/CYP19/CYP26 subfamily [Handroanthus impetiginosus]